MTRILAGFAIILLSGFALQGCSFRPESNSSFTPREKRIMQPSVGIVTEAIAGDEIAFLSQYIGLSHYRVKKPEQIKFTYMLITHSEKLSQTDVFNEVDLEGVPGVCSTQWLLKDMLGIPFSYLCFTGDLKSKKFDTVSWKPNLIRFYAPLASTLEMELGEIKFSGNEPYETSVTLDTLSPTALIFSVRKQFNGRAENKLQKVAINNTPTDITLEGINFKVESIASDRIKYSVTSVQNLPDFSQYRAVCELNGKAYSGYLVYQCLSNGGVPRI